LPTGAGAGAGGRLMPGSRPYSGLAWDSTPGPGGSTAAERPPWSVGGAVNASGAPFGAVGNSAAAGQVCMPCRSWRFYSGNGVCALVRWTLQILQTSRKFPSSVKNQCEGLACACCYGMHGL
jgi:hypothetical protein